MRGDNGIGCRIKGRTSYLVDECRSKPCGNENWTWQRHEHDYEHGGDTGRIAVPGYWEHNEYPRPILIPWPLSNLWLGTSVENREMPRVGEEVRGG